MGSHDNARQHESGGLPDAAFLTQIHWSAHQPVKRAFVARRVLGGRFHRPRQSCRNCRDEAKLDRRCGRPGKAPNPACSSCHACFDVQALTFEGYGPVGKAGRKTPVGGRHACDAPGGSSAGLDGLQGYIRANREKDFVDNLCRKMLVYALGRSLILSDEPRNRRMNAKLAAGGYRIGILVEAIVTSPQFLKTRR
jgi:hypothetical protein